jgi:hypothetical protein
MSEKSVYFHTVGPFVFDDDDYMPRQPGVGIVALRTDSQLIVTQEPTDDNNVIRKTDLFQTIRTVRVADIDNPVELTLNSATNTGALLLAYQDGDPNEYTLYAWDLTLSSGDNPYVIYVTDFGGGWVAIAGKNSYFLKENYFWQEGNTIGFKLRRDNFWVYFKVNSSYNGLMIHKVESV